MNVKPTDTPTALPRSDSLWKWLFSIIRESRYYFAFAVAMSLLTGGIYVIFLKLLQTQLLHLSDIKLAQLGLIVGSCALFLITSLFGEYTLVHVSERTKKFLRLTMLQGIYRTPLTDLEQFQHNRIYAILTNDIETIGTGLIQIPGFMNNMGMMLGCGLLIAFLDFPFFLMLLALFGALFGLIHFFATQGRLAHQAYRTKVDELFTLFYTTVFGIKELQLNQPRMTAFYQHQITPCISLLKQQFIKSRIFYMAMEKSIIWIIVAAVSGFLALLSLFGNNLLSRHYQQIFLILPGIFPPLFSLQNSVMHFDRIAVSLDRIRSFLHTLSLADLPPAAPETVPPENPSSATFQLTEIVYRFYNERHDQTFELGPISCTFQAGDLIFLTGGNGAGKTTLAKIVCGLYTPASGQLSWNHEPVTPDRQPAYRQQFSAIFSDYYLFSDFNGITRPDRVETARTLLQKFELDHKVQVHETGFSTTDLSQGQRKRLALILAILEDRPFYIFDEWAADQDPEFRHRFYTQILAEFKARQKTVLVISHDDRYFHLADHHIHLDFGAAREVTRLRAVDNV